VGAAYQINNQSGIYFLTFQVVGWADVFTRKEYKDLLIDSFCFCRKEKGLKLYAYVIMSNHIHSIMQSERDDISGLVRDFKKFTSKKLINAIFSNEKESRKDWLKMIFEYHAKFNKRNNELQFWTHENHAVELVTNEMMLSRIEYIHDNPVRAGWVFNQEDFMYSSARNYAGLEALMEVDML